MNLSRYVQEPVQRDPPVRHGHPPAAHSGASEEGHYALPYQDERSRGMVEGFNPHNTGW